MQRAYIRYLIIVILTLLALVRFLNLDSDPPLHFSGYSQAQLTDPYHVVFAARNAVLFEDWHPFDFHRWDVFMNSLVSAGAYLVFAILGVSRTTANLSSLLLQLGGILLFALGLRYARPGREVVLTVVLLLLNSTLLSFGRLPFQENGLILVSGVVFLVFICCRRNKWGMLAIGVLVAVAAFGGKLFGIIFLAPIILTTVYERRRHALLPIVACLIGVALGAVAYLLLLYDGSIRHLSAYYSEQAVEMYGTPPGLQSLTLLLRTFLSYGSESGLWHFNIIFVVLAAVGTVLSAGRIAYAGPTDRTAIPIVFCVVWIIAGIGSLMIFEYRPLRYALFLFLPLSVMAAYGLCLPFQRNLAFRLKSPALTIPFMFFTCWFVCSQVVLFFVEPGERFTLSFTYISLTALVAAVLTAAVFLIVRHPWISDNPHRLAVPLGLLVLLFLIRQMPLMHNTVIRPGEHLALYSAELTEVLDSDAVLTGAFMPTLTIDNRLRGVIYAFGLPRTQTDLFTRFPISHVTINKNIRSEMTRDYPEQEKAGLLMQILLRDQVVELYRVADAPAGMTDFERGAIALRDGNVDSALLYLQRFRERHPRSLFGNMQLTLALYGKNKLDRADTVIAELLKLHPANYMLHAFCHGYYDRLYSHTSTPYYRNRAAYHDSVAHELNPHRPRVSKQ